MSRQTLVYCMGCYYHSPQEGGLQVDPSLVGSHECCVGCGEPIISGTVAEIDPSTVDFAE